MTNPVGALARLLRCTEGQAYSLLIGLVVAVSLAVGGVPAVLRAHPAAIPSAPPPIERTQTGAQP